MLVTFAATLIMDLEMAILAGVTPSLLVNLNRASRSHVRSMAPDPRHPKRGFEPTAQGLAECPQLKIVAVEGSLCFGAVDHLNRRAIECIFERLDRRVCAGCRARVFLECARLPPPA